MPVSSRNEVDFSMKPDAPVARRMPGTPPRSRHVPRDGAPGRPTSWGSERCASGSTWWYELVTAHPGVEVVPEHAQGAALLRRVLARRLRRATTLQRYHRFFPRPAGRLVGEWTPRYMLDVRTPALLAKAAPAARLLVILRDPVERYRSHIAVHLQRVGKPTPQGSAAAADAVNRSMYEPQLRRVLRHFPREQLLVLQLERCTADTAAALRRTYEFLGLGEVDFLPLGGGAAGQRLERRGRAGLRDRVRAARRALDTASGPARARPGSRSEPVAEPARLAVPG